MRFYCKILAALFVAIVLQVLISGAGGWSEISFEAKCLVSLWNEDPALMQRLMEQAQQILLSERQAGMERREQQRHRELAATRPGTTQP